MTDFPRIVFFGTPEFAVGSLEGLITGGFPVAAVITAPDRPAGRGLKMKSSPVKNYAFEHAIQVLQPLSLKDPSFIEQIRELKPDLQIVVAFRMLPKPVWSLPPLGTFNLHASLLPQYRGAAPINRVIMNGETETGVTTFFLEETIDTGRIIFMERTPVYPEDTAGELHDRLMILGASLVVKTTKAIAKGEVKTVSQKDLIVPGVELKTAPKIFPAECRINWTKSASAVFNLVRGLSPYPGAFTEIKMKEGTVMHLKILKATREIYRSEALPGSLITDGRNFLKFACTDGLLSVNRIQPSGKRAMETREFLAGYGRMFS